MSVISDRKDMLDDLELYPGQMISLRFLDGDTQYGRLQRVNLTRQGYPVTLVVSDPFETLTRYTWSAIRSYRCDPAK